jgi:predicted nuclease of predicted toxin-antitoxin system
MTASFLTGEHVPRVFVTTLRSNGHDVVRATDEFGESTDDEQLLRYSGEHGRVLVTHDKKDFANGLGEAVEHAGIVVYTDANVLRDDPERAVRTLERVLAHYPAAELANELVWLDQWRR